MDFARGEILFHTRYVYPDGGGACDKLLLVVNKFHSSPDDVIVIPCKTKTDEDPKYKVGCDDFWGVFYIQKKIGFYGDETVVQLHHIDTVPSIEVEEKIYKKQINQMKDRPTQEEFSRIINCLKKFKEDIPVYIQEMIF